MEIIIKSNERSFLQKNVKSINHFKWSWALSSLASQWLLRFYLNSMDVSLYQGRDYCEFFICGTLANRGFRWVVLVQENNSDIRSQSAISLGTWGIHCSWILKYAPLRIISAPHQSHLPWFEAVHLCLGWNWMSLWGCGQTSC